MRVYVAGNAAKSGGGGIVFADLDLRTGKLTAPTVASKFSSSFIVKLSSRAVIYAVAEKQEGAVRALSIDHTTGLLEEMNQQSSMGGGPCHLTIDQDERNVLVVNYGTGSAAVLPIEDDGKLRPSSSSVQHAGSGPNKKRQEGPHAHSVNLDPTGKVALVCDLGLDVIKLYRFDAVAGTIVPSDPPEIAVAGGSGPRHLKFHPNGKIAYVCGEMSSNVFVFSYEADHGTLTELQTLSTLPADYTKPGNTTAEVTVHPSGKFVYVSNRGHNSIAIFEVDLATGKLTAKGQEPTGGKTPRHFAIDPTGKWLLAANQDSSNVTVFAIDQTTGGLKPTGDSIEAPMPMCVLFVR